MLEVLGFFVELKWGELSSWWVRRGLEKKSMWISSTLGFSENSTPGLTPKYLEVRLLPSFLLQWLPQFLIPPDCLQYKSSCSDFSLWAVPRRREQKIITKEQTAQPISFLKEGWGVCRNLCKHPLLNPLGSCTHPDLLINTSFSMPCVSRSFLAASKLSRMTSFMVFNTETTVSSERFLAGVCCPPGKFFTKLGMACLPRKRRRSELVRGKGTI